MILPVIKRKLRWVEDNSYRILTAIGVRRSQEALTAEAQRY